MADIDSSSIQQPRQPAPNTQLQHEAPFKKWAGLGVLTLGLAVVIIDTTLLNVSLSYIIKDLRADVQSVQWVITGYALVLASFTITGGRLGDLFGRKKIFMVGAIIVAVGSLMASSSHSVHALLLGESIIEAFGASLMLPATASLTVANFRGKERATAFGIWGAVAGASAAVGPLLGGWLTTRYSWRWGFRINIFVAAIVILGTLFLIPESKDERRPTLDWGGVILSVLGLLGIVFGIIESETYGWWKAKQAFTAFGHTLNFGSLSLVPYSIALGTIIMAVFFWWEKRVERRGKSPLVSTALGRNRQFMTGSLTTGILTLGMTGTFFSLPIFLQAVKHLDAFHTGLAFLPISAGLLVVAPLAGRLSQKITPKYIVQFGLLLAAVAALLIRSEIKADTTISHLILGLSLFGVGMGCVFAPISNLTLSAVPVNEAGEASGVNNTIRQVGTTLGAAIVGAAVLTMLISSLAKGIQASNVIPPRIKSQIAQNIQNPSANVEFGGLSSAGAPPQIAREMQTLVNEATTKATRDGYIYTAMFVLLGFAMSLFLPKTSVHDEEQHLSRSDFSADPLRGRKLFGSVAIAVLSVSGAVLLLRQSNAQIITTGATENAQDIQNLFSQNTPANNQPQIGTATSTAAHKPAPSPAKNPAPEPSAAPSKAAQKPAPAVPSIYSNQTLGFSMSITGNWQARATANPDKVIIGNADGSYFTVESYPFAGRLDEVEYQLKAGSSAQNIQSGNFAGQPAVLFSLAGSGKQSAAVVFNQKLYYITGSGLSQPPINSFVFLGL